MVFRNFFQREGKTNSTNTKDEAMTIADEMIAHHQIPEDEYIGSPDDLGFKLVRVPDWIERHLPGEENAMQRDILRSFARERFFRGDTAGLFVERLLISEETARQVIKILEKRGFKGTT